MTTIHLVSRTGAAVASVVVPDAISSDRLPQLADFAARIAARHGHAGAVLSRGGNR